MINLKNFDHTKKYAEAFWEKEIIDRPYVCATCIKDGVDLKVDEEIFNAENTFKAAIEEDYNFLLSSFKELVDCVYYGGEALPSFEVTLGPDQYAGFLGTEILSKEGYITTWANHHVEDWGNIDIKIDKSENSYFNKTKRFIEYATEYADGKFLINVLDMHSNMDALSAMRGAQNLCFDMIDCPEDVYEKLLQVNNVYREIYDMAYFAGKMDKIGTIGWSPIYCEGRSAVLQSDFSCMISPEQVRKFVVPSIIHEASCLDHNIYHYDGKEALRHLEDILAIKEIDCIQWVPGAGQPRTVEWMDLLKKIQASGKSVWIYDWTVDEIKQYHKELEPNKVAFSVSACSQDEVDSLLEYLVKNT